MSLQENLKAKIRLDRLFRKVVYTIKEPPQTRWVDKELTREILAMTDFKYDKEGSLQLYTRTLEGEAKEVLVLDNELPVYHTTVSDVLLRKSPHWQEMFSIRNIRKIMNDEDVVVSRGRDTLKRLYDNAFSRLDLTHTRDDLSQLVEEARRALDKGSAEQVRESLSLFFELLRFEPVYFEVLEPDLQFFGRPRPDRASISVFEHLIICNEETLSLGLKKGAFSLTDNSDIAWVGRYAQGEASADLRGIAVFEFLAELAMEKEQSPPPPSGELPKVSATEQTGGHSTPTA